MGEKNWPRGEVTGKIPSTVDKAWCDQHIAYDRVPEFRKTTLTRAIRMDGPFTVETSEGPLRCEDGWLCFDARGYPYPVAADEFELIYEPADVNREVGDKRVVEPVEPHPATAALLRYFAFEHLPPRLQKISQPFCQLAHNAASILEGPEATVCLRKLLEAKDCAVRAALPPA